MAFDEASLVPIAAPQRALGQVCAACRRTAAMVALALLVSPARAAELPAPGLNWVRLSGAESCISAAALAQRVETRVGRALFVAIAEAALFVDGHVSPSAVEGWQVTLELSEPGGKVLGRREMQFAGSDCSAIDEAVALVIAVTLYPNTSLVGSGIALDPSTSASLQALFGAEPVDPDPSSLPASAPATASTSTTARATSAAEHAQQRSDRVEPEPDSSSPATRAQGWRVAVDAAAAAGLGHLPGASLGVAAHVAITPPSAWPIEAGFVLFPPKTAQMDGTSGRVRFDSLAASLILCPWQPAWLAELALCAGAEVGRLRARSDGFPEGDTTANDAIANALGAARLRFQLVGALELHARLVLAVPLAQHRYTVQTDDGATATLFRIPQLAARSELGLALAF